MFAEIAYLFRHALVREAAYELQPPTERAQLHGVAFDILEAVLLKLGESELNSGALELADHASKAGRGEPEVKYLARAIRHERGRHMVARCGELCERIAMHASASDEMRLEYRTLLAYFLVNSGDPAGALEAIEPNPAEARRLGNRRLLASALTNRSFVYMRVGRPDEALADLMKALPLADAEDDIQQKLVLRVNIAVLHVEYERVDQAEPMLVEAEAIAEQIGDDRTAALCACNLAVVARIRQDWPVAEQQSRRALAMALECNAMGAQLSSRTTLANALDKLARPDEGEQQIRTVLEIARDIGLRRYETIALHNLAQRAWQRRDRAGARALFEQGLEVATGARNPRMMGMCGSRLALIDVLDGKRDAAQAMYTAALRTLRDAKMDQVAQGCIDEVRAECEAAGIEPLDESSVNEE